MKKSRKILLICLISYVLIMVGAYLGVGIYFRSHFLPGSVINGIDCSAKTVQEAEDLIANQVQDYSITMKLKDEKEETISGARMSFEYVSDGELQRLLDTQSPFLWIGAYFNPSSYSMEAKTTYNPDMLKTSMEKLECFQEENIVKSTDAYIDKSGNAYTIIPETQGNELDKDKVYELLSKAVDDGKTEVDVSQSDCYIKPQVYATDEAMNKKMNTLNKYANMTFTYEFTNSTEIITSEMINQWLKLDEDSNISFDEAAVSAYVKDLANKYDTIGSSQPFNTSLGETVYVECVTYGWSIDEASEEKQLLEDLKAGDTVSRAPIYAETAWARGENDIGDTYVEIDYTNQRMWYYKDGQLLVDTSVVTGNASKGWDSPIGIFCLADKERNATLVGEDYKTPVDYWMPYYDGVGIHDADWRSEFGGDIYKTGGSHGCINTPDDKAKIIFDNIDVGTPIICYQASIVLETEPETESETETQKSTEKTTEETETETIDAPSEE